MGEGRKIKKKVTKKSDAKKKRTGENVYVGKYEHEFNKRWTENEIKALADELIDWMEIKNSNLWYKDFFTQKRVNRQRLSEFRNKNEYFDWIMTLCEAIQESRMFKAGTSKQTNPAMFILGLKNNHGWKDRQEIETSGKIESEVIIK